MNEAVVLQPYTLTPEEILNRARQSLRKNEGLKAIQRQLYLIQETRKEYGGTREGEIQVDAIKIQLHAIIERF